MNARWAATWGAAALGVWMIACGPRKPTSSAPPTLTGAEVAGPKSPARQTNRDLSPGGHVEAGESRVGDDDGPAGILVVSSEIVRRCPMMQELKDTTADDGGGTGVWLAVLKSLADCMTQGDLSEERLVVTAASHPASVVRYVLAKLGVERDRVDVVEVASEQPCDFDDCEFFAIRIDVAQNASPRRARGKL